MAEESENSGGSFKNILLGLVGTITLAAGTYVTKLINGKEEAAQPAAAVTAPAPVINITTNNTQQQKQTASAGGTKVIERVVEKPSAPKKKTEKEALSEEPKW
jgi:flagellar basal body-associated protein FliL